MNGFLFSLGVLALAVRSYAQEITSFPVELTIALLESGSGSGTCDISQAPTLHIIGLQNNTYPTLISPEIFLPNGAEHYKLLVNGTNSAQFNFTLSNADNYRNDTEYTGIYYQQLSTDDQAENTVGTAYLAVYPCLGNTNVCRDAQGIVPAKNTKLQWSCFAEGSCYQTGFSIKFLEFGLVRNLTYVEQNNRCELAAMHHLDETSNNNTMLGEGSRLRVGGSIAGMALAVVIMVVGMMIWV